MFFFRPEQVHLGFGLAWQTDLIRQLKCLEILLPRDLALRINHGFSGPQTAR